MRVAALDAAAEAALAAAQQHGVYVIARFEDAVERTFLFQDGRLEQQGSTRTRGVGLHVVTNEGWLGFASSGACDPATVARLVDLAVGAARASGVHEPEANTSVFDLQPEPQRLFPNAAERLADLPLAAHQRAVAEVHERGRALAAGLPLKTGHSASDVEWRVVRSDGTDISFATPHAYVSHELTARGASGTVTGRCTLAGADASVVTASEQQLRLDRRLQIARRNAEATVDAPSAPSGSAKLVIDYALAKGLAHEAFGHAAETDGMETSILGKDGRVRVGETVAPPFVTIVDGPLEGDFAYQPIGANGMPRQMVPIVRDGTLLAGLGDVFSAARAGVPATGADRVESYRHPPLPRMTNIRIEVRDPLPLDLAFEDVTPADLRAVLHRHGLVDPGERVLYLSGYRGGQVNPKLGDYVFNCAAIYDLTDGVRPCKPAIFSGRTLSTLRSIAAGLGPLQLDAMGFCGKAGQTVPSSGGSHAFLVIEANPDITIGGR